MRFRQLVQMSKAVDDISLAEDVSLKVTKLFKQVSFIAKKSFEIVMHLSAASVACGPGT